MNQLTDIEIQDLLPEDSTGIRAWKNRRNGFAVVELHYSADSEKRDPAWREEARKGMPHSDWEREYELSWDTHAGKPVYGQDFNPALHVYAKNLDPELGLPLLRGWDFGMTPACVIAQYSGRRLNVLDEIIGVNIGAVRFVPQVLEHCTLNYGTSAYQYLDLVDPAGFSAGKESEETTCVDVMRRSHLSPIAGDITYEKRLGSVLELLTRFDSGRPCLMLNPRCRVLISGFRGGYQYPEKVSARSIQRIDRPLKNEFSHPHDALQYIATRVRVAQTARYSGMNIPTPRYTFVGESGS